MSNTNELGTARIGKLLWQYAIPAIIATTAASFYNIIDRIFIGHGVGPLAISGLALTLPLMNLAAAFGALVGVGSATMVSIRLGQKNKESATLILGNALLLNIIISIIFSIFTLVFLNRLLYIFGASPETLPYAKEFMQIILAGTIVTATYLGLNNIMRASGYPKKAMVTTLLTVGVNLILAPIFIFWFKWGIRGAATATVCAQLTGTIWVLRHFLSKKSYIHFVSGYFKLKIEIVRDIFAIGMSTFLLNSCSCVIIILLNLCLVKYGGDYAVGAYGIVNSIASLFVMIVIGLNQGMQPIAGYNFGARQHRRVLAVFKYTVAAASSVTSLGFLLAELIPGQLSGAFTANGQLIGLSKVGLRISLAMFPIIGFQMVTSSFFQSIGKAQISIVLSLSRQVLFLIPVLLIMPHFLGLNGVWMASPVSDFVASFVTLMVLRRQMRKIANLSE